MTQKEPKVLLEEAGPTLHCDLCPSFTLTISEDSVLDLILIPESSNDKEWYFFDEDQQATFSNKFKEAFKSLPAMDVITVNDIRRFKVTVSRLLIQEVKDRNLFRGAPGLGDSDDEDNE